MLSFLLQVLMIVGSIVSSQEVCSVSSTGPDIAGPFYLSGAPNRAILYDVDEDGIRLKLEGTVTNLECEPLSNIYIDFWQANPNGVYDEDGYKFRGGLYTDSNGKYEIYTLYPGTYSGRPSHIHVKVFIDDIPILTTQIYFDGYIGDDPWYDTLRAIKMFPETVDNTSFTATFNFIGDWEQSSNTATTTSPTTKSPTTTAPTTKSPTTTAPFNCSDYVSSDKTVEVCQFAKETPSFCADPDGWFLYFCPITCHHPNCTQQWITINPTATPALITTTKAPTTQSPTTTAPTTKLPTTTAPTTKLPTTSSPITAPPAATCCNCLKAATVSGGTAECKQDTHCQDIVCNVGDIRFQYNPDKYCCNTRWDDICVTEAQYICDDNNDDPTDITTSNPTPSPTDIPTLSPTNNPTETSALTCCDCLVSSRTSGGTTECQKDVQCQNIVCNVGDKRFRYNPDSYCCNSQWDGICVSEAKIICNDNGGSLANVRYNDKSQDDTVHRNQMDNINNTDSNDNMIWLKYIIIGLIVIFLLIAICVLLYKYYFKKDVQFQPISNVSNGAEMNKDTDTEIKNGEDIEMMDIHKV